MIRNIRPYVGLVLALGVSAAVGVGVPAAAVAPTRASAASAATAPPTFEGTFVGSGVVLQLHFDASSSRYLGSMSEDGQTSPVDLAPKGTSLAGAYVSGAVPRTLTITRSGNGLVISRAGRRNVVVRAVSGDQASQRRDVTSAIAESRVVAGGIASPIYQAGGIEFPGLPAQPALLPQPAAQPAAAAVPAFLRVGMRLTYQLGASSSPRPGSKDGPTGSQGYQQVTIAGIDKGIVAYEVRALAIDQNARAVYNIQTNGYLVPIEQDSDYWVSPRKLAALKDGTEGGQTVQRLAYPLDGTTYQAIRLSTPLPGGSTQLTYDLASGLLLVWGTDSTGDDGVRHLGSNQFLGMRQTNFPWAGQRAAQTTLALTRTDWSGTYSVAVDSAYTATYRLFQRWDVTRSDPLGLQAKVTTQVDFGNGSAPSPTTKVNTFPLASIWIDPALLATLKPDQVLDTDPISGLRTSVVSAQKGMLVLAETGAIQTSLTGYDLRSGLLAAVQLQQRHDPGTTTVFLQRTG